MISDDEVRRDLGNMGEWDRPELRVGPRPSLRVGDAYTARFTTALRAGKSLADAREDAFREAERVHRQIQGERS